MRRILRPGRFRRGEKWRVRPVDCPTTSIRSHLRRHRPWPRLAPCHRAAAARSTTSSRPPSADRSTRSSGCRLRAARAILSPHSWREPRLPAIPLQRLLRLPRRRIRLRCSPTHASPPHLLPRAFPITRLSFGRASFHQSRCHRRASLLPPIRHRRRRGRPRRAQSADPHRLWRPAPPRQKLRRPLPHRSRRPRRRAMTSRPTHLPPAGPKTPSRPGTTSAKAPASASTRLPTPAPPSCASSA